MIFEPEEIEHLRVILRMSQAHFAEVLGVNVATVNRWERGRTFPNYSDQGKLTVLEEMIQQRRLRRWLPRPEKRGI